MFYSGFSPTAHWENIQIIKLKSTQVMDVYFQCNEICEVSKTGIILEALHVSKTVPDKFSTKRMLTSEEI